LQPNDIILSKERIKSIFIKKKKLNYKKI